MSLQLKLTLIGQGHLHHPVGAEFKPKVWMVRIVDHQVVACLAYRSVRHKDKRVGVVVNRALYVDVERPLTTLVIG